MPASPDNRDGYWENLKFVGLNERLLAASGGTWFAPPAALCPTPEISADATSILAEFKGDEPWGWKDPRNALTLPFWKRLLPSMKVLVCVRHPAETAASLVASALIPRTWPFYWSVTRPDSPIARRQGVARRGERLWGAARASMSVEKRRRLVHEVGLDLWRAYNTRLFEDTGATRLVTHYDAMLAKPRAELARILAFAGIQTSSAALDDVTRVVSPRLRHQRANTPALDPELERLYADLSREAEYAVVSARHD